MDTTFLTLGLTLIAIGLLLLAVDLFIASGALAALAVVAVIVGLVFVFRYDTPTGAVTLAGLVLGVPSVGYVVLRFFPALGGWRRGQEAVPDTVEAMPAYKELANLKGRYGKTISALRPAGVVDFEGRRIDCISEGMMIEPGQWVRCVEVRVGTVVVRRADKPNLEDMETLSLS